MRAVIVASVLGVVIGAALVFGGNTQPPSRTAHPNAYGYYELGNLLIDLNAGTLDTELWIEHPGLGLPGYTWAARYQIPLQGSLTLTEAIYQMIDDATWRTHHDIRESRHPKWMPVSSMEWLFAPGAKSVTDSVLVGQPVFVAMFLR